MAFQTILYEVRDGILTITLHRPDRLNAFTGTMMRELIEAFDRSDADDAVRVVIVTGAGRAFCAGADLGPGGGTFDASRVDTIDTHRDGGGQTVLRIFESRKPVIAAINRPAVGVGITMTLPMDIRIASTAARMGFVFARRGIVMEACSSWFLPRVVGVSQAAEWAYTGRIFAAEEALAARLVSRDRRARGAAADRARHRPRDRRQHVRHFRHAEPHAALAHAGRRSPDGGAPRRLEGHLLDGSLGGRGRGGNILPREAPPALLHAPEYGPSTLPPLVATPSVPLTHAKR